MREFVSKIPSSASEHTQLNGVDTNLLIQQMLQAVPEAERDSKSSVTISQEVRNGVNFGAKFQGQDCAYEPSRTPLLWIGRVCREFTTRMNLRPIFRACWVT